MDAFYAVVRKVILLGTFNIIVLFLPQWNIKSQPIFMGGQSWLLDI